MVVIYELQDALYKFLYTSEIHNYSSQYLLYALRHQLNTKAAQVAKRIRDHVAI